MTAYNFGDKIFSDKPYFDEKLVKQNIENQYKFPFLMIEKGGVTF